MTEESKMRNFFTKPSIFFEDVLGKSLTDVAKNAKWLIGLFILYPFFESIIFESLEMMYGLYAFLGVFLVIFFGGFTLMHFTLFRSKGKLSDLYKILISSMNYLFRIFFPVMVIVSLTRGPVGKIIAGILVLGLWVITIWSFVVIIKGLKKVYDIKTFWVVVGFLIVFAVIIVLRLLFIEYSETILMQLYPV